MPGLSIHVVDVSRGIVAAGMRIAVVFDGETGKPPILITDGTVGRDGLLADKSLAARLSPGKYRAMFHVGEYYASSGVQLPTVPFLGVVNYDFGIADSEQHYHLPFKCTPWGYSCFRGGA